MTPSPTLMIMLHGYGSDGNDLAPLGPRLSPTPEHTITYSPNAPLAHPMIQGYAWFALSDISPEEVRAGCLAQAPLIQDMIRTQQEKHNIPPERTFLVGFSQGAMLALTTVTTSAHKQVAGCIAFSGGLFTTLTTPPQEIPPLCLIHGAVDDVVPAARSEMAAQTLGAADIGVQLHIIPGLPHGIDTAALDAARHFAATTSKEAARP